ncbi:MAG: ABC transporter ATP-binding protein [Leptospira sp.]|nr:ABC transporter ATP-binding protein [Leptospira sp.]
MLELSSISKNYNGIPILREISFSIQKGEILAILGPNGSGKTTLYKILSGMIQSNQGSISYNGKSTDQYFLRSISGYCPQNIIAWKNLKLREQLEYLTKIQRNPIDSPLKQIDKLLELLNLREVSKMFIHEISGGMQKRFAIAMSLIRSPKILILDEPTNGLDIHSKISIRNLLNNLISENKITILISSHDLVEIQKLTDRFFFLKKGSLITQINGDTSTDLENLYLNIYRDEN